MRSRDSSSAPTCGGSFFAGGERYGYGWHRDRGPLVCSSALRVGRRNLEGRVFTAIGAQALVPVVVFYAIQCALDVVNEASGCTTIRAPGPGSRRSRDSLGPREAHGDGRSLGGYQVWRRTGWIESMLTHSAKNTNVHALVEFLE